MEDIVFYIMDAGVFCLFIYMLWRSRSVVIESKVGNKWIVAGLFFLLGLVGFMNYRPFFTWFQMIFMAPPGIHKPLSRLGEGMNEAAIGTISDADCVLWIVDISVKPNNEDERLDTDPRCGVRKGGFGAVLRDHRRCAGGEHYASHRFH